MDNFCGTSSIRGGLTTMKRGPITALVGAALLAACSPGQGDPPDTAPATSTDPDPADHDRTAGSSRSARAETDAAGGTAARTAASPDAVPTSDAARTEADASAARVLWTSEVTPVSGPTLVDGVPVLYLVDGRTLTIAALDPEDGTVAWSRPATPSKAPGGVGLYVTQVDGQVAHLTPAVGQHVGTDEGGLAVPVLRDPHTGEATMTGDTAYTTLRLPAPCEADRTVVCTQVPVDDDSRTEVWWSQRGQPTPVPGTLGWEGIGPLGLSRSTGGELGRFDGRELLWTYLPSGDSSPASGWSFEAHAEDTLLVGTVGVTDRPARFEFYALTDYAVFALDAATGELAWRVPGTSVFCDDTADVGGERVLLACRYRSGLARSTHEGLDVRKVEADLVRLDPATGEELWSVDLTPGAPLEGRRGIEVRSLDEHHVVALDTVVDVRDGSSRDRTEADVLWTTDEAATELDVPGLEDAKVWGRWRYQLPPGTRLPDAPPPWPLPPGVGVELPDGTRLVAHESGVTRFGPPHD